MANEIIAPITLIQNRITAPITLGGPPGSAATVTLGTISTGAPGSPVIITNSGTIHEAVWNITIPRGATGNPGPANTLSIGSVTGGTTASATLTGTSPNQTLNLVLPQGGKGDKGDKGDKGADSTVPGPQGNTGPGVPAGGTTGQVLAKNSGTSPDTHWISLGSASLANTGDFAPAATATTVNAATVIPTVNTLMERDSSGGTNVIYLAAWQQITIGSGISQPSPITAQLCLYHAASDYMMLVQPATLTDNQALTLPDKTGTVAITTDIPSLGTIKTALSTGGSNAMVAGDIGAATAAQGTDERVPTAAGLTTKFSTSKATIADGDGFAIFDSEATPTANIPKKTLWSTIRSKLDGLYAAIGDKFPGFGTTAGTALEATTAHVAALTDSRPASDVYSWAKAATKPSYNASEVNAAPSTTVSFPGFGTTHTTAAYGDHSHGNITNAGAIGSATGLPVITTTSGVLTTGSFGATAGTFAQGNDSRIVLGGTSAQVPYAQAILGTGTAAVQYVAKAPWVAGQSVSIRHKDPEGPKISVSDGIIAVGINASYWGGTAPTSDQVAAAVNADSAASALVTAYGSGSGTVLFAITTQLLLGVDPLTPENIAAASRREIKYGNFTAAAYGRYSTANASVTVTDPPTGNLGESYDVLSTITGVTIGGVYYNPSQCPVYRYCSDNLGPVWTTLPPPTPAYLGAALAIETKTAQFTAVVGGRYITEPTVPASAVCVSHPTTRIDGSALVKGDSYEVWIGSGTVLFDGNATLYGASRWSIRCRYTGATWSVPAPTSTDLITANGGITIAGATTWNQGATFSFYSSTEQQAFRIASGSAASADINSATYIRLQEVKMSLGALQGIKTWMASASYSVFIPSGQTAGQIPYLFRYNSADYPTVNERTTKMRVKADVHCNETAPGASFAFGLYEITRPSSSAGGSGNIVFNIGNVVAGSTTGTVTTPAARSSTGVIGSDFDVSNLTDGHYYCLCMVTSGASTATNSYTAFNIELQMRNY